MCIDAMKVAGGVLTASNCRETVSLFANYTGSKGPALMYLVGPLFAEEVALQAAGCVGSDVSSCWTPCCTAADCMVAAVVQMLCA